MRWPCDQRPATVTNDRLGRGALAPLTPDEAARLPGVVRGFMWPAEFLMFSDFLVAQAHAHSAIQVVIGMDGPCRVEIDGAWREIPGVVIGTDVSHCLDAAGSLVAIGWVEAESHLGERIGRRPRSSRGWAAVDEQTAAGIAELWRPALDRSTPCSRGYRAWRQGLALLAGEEAPPPPVDPRIDAVLAYLRRAPSPSPTITQLMAVATLSESRLQHLFREQVGVPIRRYLLWQRILTAMSLLAEGASITDAAHGAGFADGPHLTRTTHRMNGVSPGDMRPVDVWLSNCR
jgi:AraC-type DNA-binding domain-containing proteins